MTLGVIPLAVWPDLENFATLTRSNFLQFFESLFSVWHSLEPTLSNFDVIGLIFIDINCQILKNNLDIWSHCPHGSRKDKDQMLKVSSVVNHFPTTVVTYNSSRVLESIKYSATAVLYCHSWLMDNMGHMYVKTSLICGVLRTLHFAKKAFR